MCDGDGKHLMNPALSAGIPTECKVRPTCNRTKPCECGRFCCYNQPPRAQSFRPVANFARPAEQMQCDTIYSRSYYQVGDAPLRPKPILPSNNLRVCNGGTQDMNTIQKLSYQGYAGVRRVKPILPAPSRQSQSCAPQYLITTQQHDFVVKPMQRTRPILPSGNIDRTCAPFEQFTINKLSFMPIDIAKFPPPKPIRPMQNCDLPKAPFDSMTIQKLSYMPAPLAPKEPQPWKHSIRHQPPPYPCAQGTTYSLSYMPNLNVSRRQAFLPHECARLFGNEVPKPCTIYNLSYMLNNATRSQPIKPVPNLVSGQGSMEKCTVYKLSYQPNKNNRTLPILPVNNQLKNNEPMAKMTTQKHDFTVKPYSKPYPIIHPQNIPRLAGPSEQCTINRLSYMPIDIAKYLPRKPIKPAENPKYLPPLSAFTTYNLSYMPQSITPKEKNQWQQKAVYCKPSQPLESLTIQKLSYMPPGSFNGACSCSKECQNETQCFPRAEVC